METDKNKDRNIINAKKGIMKDFSEHDYPSLNLKGGEEKVDDYKTEATEKVPENRNGINDTDDRDMGDSTKDWNAEENRSGRKK